MAQISPSLADKSHNLNHFKDLARKNNPTLVEAQAQVRAERGKALQAGLWPNPDLQYSGELMGENPGPLGEFQGGGIQQRIRLGGKLKYSRLKYQARVEAAEQEARAQTLRVLNDVEIHFFAVIADQEKLKLQKELLKSSKDWLITRREMLNTGQANLADLHLANIELAKQELAVIKAENHLAFSWEKLATVCGIGGTDYRELEGDIYKSPAEIKQKPALDRLLSDSPVLAKAHYKLRSDEITVKREHRQRVPDLVLVAQAGYDQQGRSFATNVGVNLVDIPVWNRNQGTIEQAQADLTRQKARIRLLQLRLRRQFAMIFTEYLTAQKHVQIFNDVVLPEARARYQVNLNSYKNARLAWPDVLSSQKDYFIARSDYVDHLLAVRRSTIELNGLLLTGGLETPIGVTPPGHIDATPQPR